MDTVEWLPLLMRWSHMLGAVIIVGGTLFMYVSLRSSLTTLEPEVRAEFRRSAMDRWKHLVAVGMVLLLVSGFYNYLAITRHNHDGQGLYHALFGVKFLVALATFALLFIVTSTMKWSEGLRDKSMMWHLAVATALAVLLIAGFMRMMPAAV